MYKMKKRLDDGESMTFNVEIYGKKGCYFQTLD
jgi:hypothetical protein